MSSLLMNGGRGRRTNRHPLPVQIKRIRDESFSIFVSNLPQQISKTELETMFWRAGRIIDMFIPVDKRSNRNRGFAFVRFATFKEAEKVVQLAKRRSWGGRKVQANITQLSSSRSVRGEQEMPREVWKANPPSFFSLEVLPTGGLPE
eukprot:TRINITY_DN14439_c0_g1_i14.p1 TRINITY_DN14439_c0_g1~~TRINITY_DN14439_c0_g1_i14.p1  ORF type:complete len:147 (+),score=27.06 TRINITY_DN14439_c0_g1_i14:267-707(+)